MTLTLLHYSDPHFGAVNRDIAEAALNEAKRLSPDLMVVSGDFTMRGRRREFRAAREWLDRLPNPLVTVPGNHDVPALNDLWDRFFTPFKRYRTHIVEDEEPQVVIGNLLQLVSANSCTPFGWHRDWSRGFLSPLQASRIEHDFTVAPDVAFRVFLLHHPVLASGEKERALVSPLGKVGELLEKCEVDLLLAGHFHQSRIGLFPLKNAKRSLVVSQAPSICSTRLKGEPNGFHFLKLAPESISVSQWQWQEAGFRQTREEIFARTDSGWQMTR